ncbi:MAG: hypothetical protein ACJ0Q2_04115 [Candidatus Azotimanducaceae bacterium]
MDVREVAKNLAQESADNPRVRAGVWVILIILAIYLIVAVSEFAESSRRILLDELMLLDDIQTIQSQEYWREKLEQEKGRGEDLRLTLWSASSENRIKVEAQSKLLAISRKVGLKKPEINVSEIIEVDGLPKHFQIKLSLEGFFDKSAFLQILNDFELAKPALVIERLKIATSPKKNTPGRLEIIASAFFVLDQKNARN